VSNSLYIAATEERAGKALVALGVMDLLAQRVDRIGVFRPVIANPDGSDSLVELLIAQYNLEITMAEACPLTYADIAEFIENGESEKVVATAVEAFSAIRGRVEFFLF
jgi:phosphate acetyltransferase